MTDNQSKAKIKILKDGPYLISGNVPMSKQTIVIDDHGYSVEWGQGPAYPQKQEYTLCRCGNSQNKPYCDGAHSKSKFDGTETASKVPFLEKAKKYAGPDLDLLDVPELCASARFCDLEGGVWKRIPHSDEPKTRAGIIQGVCDCPSGRIVVLDKKTGKPIEPLLETSISITDDPKKKVGGPIWVKGGIPVEAADGSQYEVRNRVTLCRCGKSLNKPFCDGKHISSGFKDE